MAAVLLVLLVVVPASGALVAAVCGRRPEVAIAVGVAGALLSVVFAFALLAIAPPWHVGGDVTGIDMGWLGLLGSRLHLGWDGISAPLIVLTALLGALSCGYLWASDDDGIEVPKHPGDEAQPVAAQQTSTDVLPARSRQRPPPPGLVGCVLATQAAATLTFAARDLLVFFVGFEGVLIPMWVLIARWGGPRRREASITFVLYTALGSAVLMLGVVLLAISAGGTDFALLAEVAPRLPRGVQIAVAILLLVGLGVKLPAWPLHGWLPMAHTVAPTVGSVLLAGVLLKLGSYGMVRLVAGFAPQGLAALAVPVGILGVIGICWGGLVCLVERDLKRLVAFSSVAHMGFVLVGVASGTPEGLQGALFVGVAHGLITSLLFWVVGMIKHRHFAADSADLYALPEGLRDSHPRLGWMLTFGCAASLGLPGLAGFWGEIIALLGAWRSPAGWYGSAAGWITLAGVIGTTLAMAYLLRVLYLIWHGRSPIGEASEPVASEPVAASTATITLTKTQTEAEPTTTGAPDTAGDLSNVEIVVLAPLVLASTAVGLQPWLVLSMSGDAIRALVATW